MTIFEVTFFLMFNANKQIDNLLMVLNCKKYGELNFKESFPLQWCKIVFIFSKTESNQYLLYNIIFIIF